MQNTEKPNIKDIVCEHILNNPTVVVDSVDVSMVLDRLNVDSLEKLSLAMDFEELFDIEISDEQVESFTTIDDMIAHIKQALAAESSIDDLADLEQFIRKELQSEAEDNSESKEPASQQT